MKKLIALLAAAAFVLSMATMASAAHEGRHLLQTSGMYQTDLVYADNENFTDDDANQSQMEAHMRLRQYFDYVASENLKAVVGYEIDAVFGGAKAPGSADAGDGSLTNADGDVVNPGDDDDFLELKRLNREFTVPNSETTVKAGMQWMELPSVALGANPVLSDDMPGVVVSTPVADMADLTFGWTRKYEKLGTSSQGPGADSFFASMPIEQDGFSFGPFAVYSVIGKDAWNGNYNSTGDRQTNAYQDDATAFHLGTNLKVNQFDPIGAQASFIYGSLDAENSTRDADGWYTDVAVNYKMERMTPEVFFMYSSGNDDDSSDGSEEMPVVDNVNLTSVYPSMLMGDVTYTGIGNDVTAGVALVQGDPMGLMQAGFTLKDIQLTEAMTGTFTVTYLQGTSDEDNALGSDNESTFTEEDSAYDVTAAVDYAIYEQLSAICEVGYAKADYDDSIGTRDNDYKDDPATRAGLALLYSF